jgi:hypothetical protein
VPVDDWPRADPRNLQKQLQVFLNEGADIMKSGDTALIVLCTVLIVDAAQLGNGISRLFTHHSAPAAQMTYTAPEEKITAPAMRTGYVTKFANHENNFEVALQGAPTDKPVTLHFNGHAGRSIAEELSGALEDGYPVRIVYGPESPSSNALHMMAVMKPGPSLSPKT